MKRLILGLVVFGWAVLARADGWSTSYALAGGSVGLTNTQVNSVWAPVAVLFKFDVATNACLTVTRESQGASYLVSSQAVVNVSTAIWVPEAAYPFGTGDVLRVTSTYTNAVLQVIRKGG